METEVTKKWPRDERARVRTMTMRWGMSMVVVGPIAFVAMLMALGGW